MKEKKESNFSRLMDYAENYRYFTYISLVLSAVSSVLALLPFYYIWKIIKEVLDVMPNFENATGIVKKRRNSSSFCRTFNADLYCCIDVLTHKCFQGSGKYAQADDAQNYTITSWGN